MDIRNSIVASREFRTFEKTILDFQLIDSLKHR